MTSRSPVAASTDGYSQSSAEGSVGRSGDSDDLLTDGLVTRPSADFAACRHGVEAGNYCAKCGREIVTGPIVANEQREKDVLRALAAMVGKPLGRIVP